MKVNILSINPITVIPSLRFIVHFFIEKMNASVTLTETHVKSFNNYYNNIASFQFNNIKEYDTYQEFRNQTTAFKINKYLIIIRNIISILKKQEKQLIYTNDYQVLFFILWIQKLFERKNNVLVYHQFELIELRKLNKINNIFYRYVLKKANTIDLTIFPEVNRLNYFKNESSLIKEKAFILPNSCEAINHSNNKRHPLLNQLPSDAFVVAHIGNVGGNQHYYNNFIAAIEKLVSNKKLFFIFLGRKNEMIEKTIKQKQLSNLIFINPVPHEELTQIYPFIDLGVILYKGTSPNYEFCAPNKLYEMWANGIPVFGHQLKGLIPLFDTQEKGILANFDKIEEIVNTITKFIIEKGKDKTQLIQVFDKEIAIDNHLTHLQKRLVLLLETNKEALIHE